MDDFEKTRIDGIWQYSLMDALANRRSIRFPRGCEITDAPYTFKSEQGPVPLTDLELAILCWAGHGITGTIAGELDVTCNTFNSWVGRTHPNPCNDQKQYLLFYNDDGIFIYNPKGSNATVEIKTPDDREKILTQYKEGLIKIQDGRPVFPPPAFLKMNQWKENKPGTTTFMPVNDLVYEYINMLFAIADDERWQLVDMMTGKAAGVQKWIDNGYLNGPPVPVNMLESLMAIGVTSTGQYMLQNIALAATAMGLNGHPWGGFTGLIVMGGTPFTRGLGFRYVTGKDMMPTPVGIDGHIQSMVPPYVKNVDEAVDIYLNDKFGSKGMFTEGYEGSVPFKDKTIPSKIRRPSEESEEIVRAYVNYVYNTYGRFPAFVDALIIPAAYTATHADFDFYKKYHPEEYLTDTIRNHMDVWHSPETVE